MDYTKNVNSSQKARMKASDESWWSLDLDRILSLQPPERMRKELETAIRGYGVDMFYSGVQYQMDRED